jgi:Nuclease A inhibitor-like protein
MTAKTPAPAPSKKVTSKARPSLAEEFTKAAKGILFSSESDYPLEFFTIPAEGVTDLTPDGFLNRLGLSFSLVSEFQLPLHRLIEERSLDRFFLTLEGWAEHHNSSTTDPKVVAEYKKYRRVEVALNKHLTNLKFFRVGQVEVRCYVIGLDAQGHIAGLVTTSVET